MGNVTFLIGHSNGQILEIFGIKSVLRIGGFLDKGEHFLCILNTQEMLIVNTLEIQGFDLGIIL